MAKNVKIRGITYSDLPAVQIPLADNSGNNARFVDTDSGDATAGDLRSGKKAWVDGQEVTGSMTEKNAATYLPSGSDQVIESNQYLKGAQTIKAVTTTNLNPANIAKDVVVKVGCATDDDSVISVTGTLDQPVITQDPTSKELFIS